MLTVVIETRNSEEGLARTLGTLVSAAVEGVVRDVIVTDRGSTDQTHRVAEHAGCYFLTGNVTAAVKQAKSDWLLFLEPGARLSEGWMDPVTHHIAKHAVAARFTHARADRGFFLLRLFARNRALAHGLLISKRQALSVVADDAETLARGMSKKRLSAEIFVASAL